MFRRRKKGPKAEDPEALARYLVSLGETESQGAYIAYEFLTASDALAEAGKFPPESLEGAPTSSTRFSLLVARMAGPTYSKAPSDAEDRVDSAHTIDCLVDANAAVGGTHVSRSPVGDLFYRSLRAWVHLMSYGWMIRFGEPPPSRPEGEHVAPPGIREFLEVAAGRFADSVLNHPLGTYDVPGGAADTLSSLDEYVGQFRDRYPVVTALEGRPPIAETLYTEVFPDGVMPYEDFLEGTRDEVLARQFYPDG